MKSKPKALYIHVPFCEHLCYYCDYPRILITKQNIDLYLDKLEEELKLYNPEGVETIYVGGGTPSALPLVAFKRLFSIASKYSSDVSEYSVEGNVENLSKEKLLILKEAGVNRLSIGVQSLNNQTLKAIGRRHTKEEAIEVINLAKSLGFSNISIDLIYGLPNQSLENLKAELDLYLKLNLNHIATYALDISPHTVFGIKKLTPISDELSREMYDYILATLRKHGYNRYETSTFAKPGYECKHNLTYWRNEQYYGVGYAASGYINNIRYVNTYNLTAYLNGKFIGEINKVTPSNIAEYFLLTNLRREAGFSLDHFKNHVGVNFKDMFKKEAKVLEENGLLHQENNRVFLSDEGMIRIDYVLIELIKNL